MLDAGRLVFFFPHKSVAFVQAPALNGVFDLRVGRTRGKKIES
jgi:hypothetical protein